MSEGIRSMNGPAASSAVIVYVVSASSDGAPVLPFFWYAASAFLVFIPMRPSMAPGEKPARSSMTWSCRASFGEGAGRAGAAGRGATCASVARNTKIGTRGMSAHSLKGAAIAADATILAGGAHVDFHDAERALGEHLAHQRHGHVVDRNSFRREPFGLPVMGVTVAERGPRIPSERLFEAAAAEEWKDLQRLSLDGRLNRRVVKNGDAPIV